MTKTKKATKRRKGRSASKEGLGFCPVCGSDQIQIGDCDVWNGYISFETWEGKEYEADCLSCLANGEGTTIEAAILDMKPN